MRLRLKIAANTGAQLVGKGISAASSLIITILIAQHFGVEGYGELTKILTFTAIFYLAADFGLNAITVKELGGASGFGGSFLSPLQTLFSTRIILGILLTWLAVMITVFLPYSPETGEGFSRAVKLGIIIFAPTILLQALIRSTNAYFQHKLRYDKAALAIVVGSLTGLALIAGVAYLQISSILIVTAALAIALFAQTSIAYFLFKKTLNTPLDFSFNIARILSLLKKSLPLGLTLVLNIAFFRLDIFFLAIFRSTSEVGLYGLAYKFFEFPLVIPTFFMNAVYPVMNRIKNQESRIKNNVKISWTRESTVNSQWSNILRKSSLFLLISSILLTTAFWILAPYITLIKQDFEGSVVLFRLLVLWLPLFFLSSLFMWTSIASGRYWKLAGIYALGLAFNIILNIIFIPPFGAPAAAVTTGATELIILSLLVLQLRK